MARIVAVAGSTEKKSWRSPMPATGICCLAFIAVNVAFNFSTAILHSYFPARLQSWLAFSKGITTLMAGYVPAVDFVFSFVSQTPFSNRAAFLQNIVATNWALNIVFAVTITFLFPIEVFFHRASFVAYEAVFIRIFKRMYPKRRLLLRWKFLALILVCFAAVFWDPYTGTFITGAGTPAKYGWWSGRYRLYLSDSQIWLIALGSVSLGVCYFGILLAAAQVIFYPPAVNLPDA